MDEHRAIYSDHGHPARWSVGGLLIEALAQRDFSLLADCLEDGVVMRALLPSGVVERHGAREVVDRFRHWFEADVGEIEVVDATVGDAGERLYLRWRIAVPASAPGERRRVVEQHAFAAGADRITGLDLLSSGFVPERSSDRPAPDG